jgi:hypothetical protein
MTVRSVSIIAVLALTAGGARAGTNWTPRVRAVARFILAQQTKHGCIPDEPKSLRANVNGATANALLGLAHAYRATNDRSIRRGLLDGVVWLASRMERSSGHWLGSWRAAYSTKAPYVALPTPPHADAEDARGGSSAGALFVYAVAVTYSYTDDDAFARKMLPYVRAATDFLLERNLGDNGLFHSGWIREKGSPKWTREPMQYAIDQGTVYLGLRAAAWFAKSTRYGNAADRLERMAPRLLFDRDRRAFGIGLDPRGKLMPAANDWAGYVTQGYLAWVFGADDGGRDAVRWLRERLAPDGTMRAERTEQPYTISALAFCLGTSRTGLYSAQRNQVVRLLRDKAVTEQGGICAVLGREGAYQNHLAAWLLPAWFGTRPMPFRQTE